MDIFPGDGFGFNLVVRGEWESWELDVFRSCSHPGMRVVDVGAHVGLYTLTAAKIVGSDGTVFSIEPEPRNFDLLLRNIKLNKLDNVIPFNVALADENARIQMYVHPFRSELHSLAPLQGNSQRLGISTTRLDDLITDSSVDLIKIDIEGAEPLALEGMLRLLERSPKLRLFAEFSPRRIRAFGRDPIHFVVRLESLGFQPYWLDNQRRAFVRLSSKSMGVLPQEGTNLLCLRQVSLPDYSSAIRILAR